MAAGRSSGCSGLRAVLGFEIWAGAAGSGSGDVTCKLKLWKENDWRMGKGVCQGL
jgi:hypothetical protein